jgi:hypothetical protein
LALTTLFAFVFAILRGFEAPAAMYLFSGTLAVAICLAQMIFGSVPRVASITAGVVLLPVWVIVAALLEEGQGGRGFVTEALTSIPCTALAGGLIGYLAGAVMAGFFLLLDLARKPGSVSVVAGGIDYSTFNVKHPPSKGPENPAGKSG